MTAALPVELARPLVALLAVIRPRVHLGLRAGILLTRRRMRGLRALVPGVHGFSPLLSIRRRRTPMSARRWVVNQADHANCEPRTARELPQHLPRWNFQPRTKWPGPSQTVRTPSASDAQDGRCRRSKPTASRPRGRTSSGTLPASPRSRSTRRSTSRTGRRPTPAGRTPSPRTSGSRSRCPSWRPTSVASWTWRTCSTASWPKRPGWAISWARCSSSSRRASPSPPMWRSPSSLR
jgi:hypothetical protein